MLTMLLGEVAIKLSNDHCSIQLAVPVCARQSHTDRICGSSLNRSARLSRCQVLQLGSSAAYPNNLISCRWCASIRTMTELHTNIWHVFVLIMHWQALSTKSAPKANVLQVTLEDLQRAQAQIGPSAMREVALEVPKVTWADVGGLQGVKQRLQEAVQWPQQHAASLARLGARVRMLAMHCPPLAVLRV